MIANSSWMIAGARPSDGSSHIRIRGRDISARAIASICCSPPLSVPACWRRRSRSRGNTEYQRSMSSGDLLARADDGGAEQQILLDGEIDERAATLRDVREAELDAAGRMHAAKDVPSSSIRPRAGMVPDSARSVVVLPAPLDPSSATIVPSSIAKLDAAQNLQRAVAGVEPCRR